LVKYFVKALGRAVMKRRR